MKNRKNVLKEAVVFLIVAIIMSSTMAVATNT
jgi:hypothetical protein